jgi:hypothetical protein
MIILSNQPKILPFVPKWEWITPSQTQPKSEFGHENHTRFKIVARLNDGHPVWTGWFDDRDDADAFLYAAVLGNIDQQPALWNLPLPSWSPGYGEQIAFYFSTVTYITTTATTSYTTPSTWTNGNIIECVGGGGGGANGPSGSSGGTGGGGGGYAKGPALNISASTTITINIGTGGGQNADGGNTYFNGTSLATSSVGASNGGRGFPNSTTVGLGGQASSAKGSTLAFNGGNGGARTYGGGGGGGAAGPNAAGNNGSDSIQANGGNGGQGDGTFGGIGGQGDTSGGGSTAGSAGTEYTGSIGCGGGGGGGGGDANLSSGSKGGNYGAGGGGGGQATGGGYPGGAGIQGFMVITYGLAYSTPGFFMLF